VPEIDRQVTAWFQQHAHPGLTSAARTITFFGSVGFITFASVCCALFFFLHKRWDDLLLLGLTMIGGSVLNVLLKHFFHRQRPVFENPLVTLTSYGFPSGHTMGSTLFYGLLALIALHSWKKWRWRIAAFLAAPLIVIAVGLTRIYLGAHYLTDVLAAIAAGSVWLALCWTAVGTLRKRRR
jgi:undecaprenyl-diphosphatase